MTPPTFLTPGDELVLYQDEPLGRLAAGQVVAISVELRAVGQVDRSDVAALQGLLRDYVTNHRPLFGPFPKLRQVGPLALIELQAVGSLARAWGSVSDLKRDVRQNLLGWAEFSLDYASGWQVDGVAVGDLEKAPRRTTVSEDAAPKGTGMLDVLPEATTDAVNDVTEVAGSVGAVVGGGASGLVGGIFSGLGVGGSVVLVLVVVLVVAAVVAFYYVQVRAAAGAAT